MATMEQPKINGLDQSKLKEVVNDFKTKPDVVKATNGPWYARVEWQGGLKAKAYMRTHSVTFDEPAGLGATDSSASAHEHLLSAAGACMLTGFIFQATLKGIRVHNAEIAMEGSFGNIQNWAALSDEGTPGYPEIKAKLFVKADADRSTLEKLWENAWKRSVVTQTIARGAKITPSFEAV
jgi:uncharacterized OsmC-like protein